MFKKIKSVLFRRQVTCKRNIFHKFFISIMGCKKTSKLEYQLEYELYKDDFIRYSITLTIMIIISTATLFSQGDKLGDGMNLTVSMINEFLFVIAFMFFPFESKWMILDAFSNFLKCIVLYILIWVAENVFFSWRISSIFFNNKSVLLLFFLIFVFVVGVMFNKIMRLSIDATKKIENLYSESKRKKVKNM